MKAYENLSKKPGYRDPGYMDGSVVGEEGDNSSCSEASYSEPTLEAERDEYSSVDQDESDEA
jgi:hypothetical protein